MIAQMSVQFILALGNSFNAKEKKKKYYIPFYLYIKNYLLA